MSLSSSNPASLLSALNHLRQDPRLARVFSQDIINTCAISLWLLEIKSGQTREYRLLFGWIIPRSVQEPGWSNPSKTELKRNVCIRRLTLHHSGSKIHELVKHLCQGLTLGEACTQTGLDLPKEPLGLLRLADSQEQIAEYFAVRPVVFLKAKADRFSVDSQPQMPVCPHENVSAFAGSLYRCDKLNLFPKSTGEPFPQMDESELARECLQYLQAETGLNFCHADGARLGNIEWLAFPAADVYENPQVELNIIGQIAKVKLLSGVLPAGTPIWVQCRAMNAGMIVLDQGNLTQTEADETEIIFNANEQINKALISIYTQKTDSQTWEIWYQHSVQTIQIQVSLSVKGPEIHMPSEWLQSQHVPKKNKTIQGRIGALQSFTPVSEATRITPRIGQDGHGEEPWVAESKEMYSLTQKIFPHKSGGQFFGKGWDDSDPGRLQFFEWLQMLTSDSCVSKVLIIDPYFDASGITELIARVTATQADYKVLVCQSKDNFSKLKATCKEHSFLLKNFKFQLLKSKAEFHDRYILIFDEFSNAKTGYHLSNSIQGATKSHPLLITPIPQDILFAVSNYVDGLMNPSVQDSRKIELLFDSKSEQITTDADPSSSRVAAIPNVNEFFAVLLQDQGLRSLDEAELTGRLTKRGLYNPQTQSFVAADEYLDQVYRYFDRMTQFLVTSDSTVFAQLWISLGEWLARWIDTWMWSQEFLDRINFDLKADLASKLEAFLSSDAPRLLHSSVESAQPSDHIEATWLFDELIQKKMNQTLREVDSSPLWYPPFQGTRYSCIDHYGIQYAATALIRLTSETLIALVSKLYHSLSGEAAHDHETTQSLSQKHLLRLIMVEILEAVHLHAHDQSFLLVLISSDIPFLRAIAVHSLLKNSHTNLEEAVSLLDHLEVADKIDVWFNWLERLQRRLSASRVADEEQLKQLRAGIFEQIQRCLSVHFCQAQLCQIFVSLIDTYEENRANLIETETFHPLIETGQLTVTQVAELYFSMLKEQIQNERRMMITHNLVAGEQLLNLCAWSFTQVSPEKQSDLLDKLEDLRRNQRGIINQPFLRFRDFNAWEQASVYLLWLDCLIYALSQVDEFVQMIQDPDIIKRLVKLANQLETTLKLTQPICALPAKQPLWDFLAKNSQESC